MDRISRQEALAAGVPRYFTGKPCKHGHIAERLTNARVCIECHRIRGARSFAKRFHSDPEWAARHNAVAREWKKANKPKKRAQATRWRAANTDKISQYNKKWYEKNPEKSRANNTRWRRNNREKIRRLFREWETANPERAALHRRTSKVNRRTREIQNGGKCTVHDIEKLFVFQRGKCAGCGKKTTLQIDHILAVAKGGSSDPSNLQLLCFPCNISKGKKDALVWAQEHGRLL